MPCRRPYCCDGERLDTVERLIPLADEAGLPMTHLAMAFAIIHPAVTSALVGPRTMSRLDDLLAGMSVTLGDDILDRIDELVPPGTDIGASSRPTSRRPSSLRIRTAARSNSAPRPEPRPASRPVLARTHGCAKVDVVYELTDRGRALPAAVTADRAANA